MPPPTQDPLPGLEPTLPGPTDWTRDTPPEHDPWASPTITAGALALLRATVDPAELRAAMRNPRLRAQAAALANPACPQDIIDALMHQHAHPADPARRKRDPNATALLETIAARPANRPEHWAALLATRQPSVLETLAGNPAAPLHILRALLHHRSSTLRPRLAGNPAVPLPLAEAATRAAIDEANDSGLLAATARATRAVAALTRRADLPPGRRHAILAAILPHRPTGPWPPGSPRSTTVRAALLLDASPLHPAAIDAIARYAITALASPRPNPPRTLQAIATTALAHPSASPATIHWAAEQLLAQPDDPHAWATRLEPLARTALEHPACPTDLLEAACGHANPAIRQPAAANPACPDHAAVHAALLA